MDIASLLVRFREQGANDVSKASERVGGSIEKAADRAGKAGRALTAGVTLPVAGLGIASVMMASNLQENLSKVNVVFGQSQDQIVAWSQGTATSMGLSQNAALEAAGGFGNLFKTMGVGEADRTAMSQDMVKLAGDLASFSNVPVEEALAALQSGLIGESEPMRKFGVLLDEASVNAKAMELGLVDANGEVTNQGKVLARNALILEQTGTAQGDFARTSGGMANQMRIARAQAANLGTMFGAHLLPMATKLLGGANKLLAGLGKMSPEMQKMIVIGAAAAAALGPLLIVLGQMAAGFPIVAGAIGLLLSPIALVAAAGIGLAVLFRDELAGAFGAVAGAVSDFVGALMGGSGLADALRAINGDNTPAWLTGLADVVDLVVGRVMALDDVFRIFRNVGLNPLEAVIATVRDAFDGLGAALMRGASIAAGWALDVGIPAITGWIADHAGDVWGAITAAAGWAWNGIAALGAWTFDVAVPAVTGWVADHAGDAWAAIKSAAGWAWDGIANLGAWTLDVAAPAIGGWLKDAAINIGIMLGATIGTIGELTSTFADWLLNIDAPDTIYWVEDVAGWLGTTLQDAVTAAGVIKSEYGEWQVIMSRPDVRGEGQEGTFTGWVKKHIDEKLLLIPLLPFAPIILGAAPIILLARKFDIGDVGTMTKDINDTMQDAVTLLQLAAIDAPKWTLILPAPIAGGIALGIGLFMWVWGEVTDKLKDLSIGPIPWTLDLDWPTVNWPSFDLMPDEIKRGAENFMDRLRGFLSFGAQGADAAGGGIDVQMPNQNWDFEYFGQQAEAAAAAVGAALSDISTKLETAGTEAYDAGVRIIDNIALGLSFPTGHAPNVEVGLAMIEVRNTLDNWIPIFGERGESAGREINAGLGIGLDAARETLSTALTTMSERLQGFVRAAGRYGTAAGADFDTNLGTGTGAARLTLAGDIDAMGMRLASFATNAARAGNDGGNGFYVGIRDGMNAALGAAQSIGGRISGALASAGSGAFGYGYSIGAQFAAGLAASAVLVSGAAGLIRSLLPSSPAKRGPLREPVSFRYITDDLIGNMRLLPGITERGMAGIASALGSGASLSIATTGGYGGYSGRDYGGNYGASGASVTVNGLTVNVGGGGSNRSIADTVGASVADEVFAQLERGRQLSGGLRGAA